MSTGKAEIIVYTSPGDFSRKKYEQYCIRSVREPELLNEFTLPYMIAMFEEETLEKLNEEEVVAHYENSNNENNNTYNSNYEPWNNNRRWGGANEYTSLLHRNLDELAQRLNINIKVFIGHLSLIHI